MDVNDPPTLLTSPDKHVLGAEHLDRLAVAAHVQFALAGIPRKFALRMAAKILRGGPLGPAGFEDKHIRVELRVMGMGSGAGLRG